MRAGSFAVALAPGLRGRWEAAVGCRSLASCSGYRRRAVLRHGSGAWSRMLGVLGGIGLLAVVPWRGLDRSAERRLSSYLIVEGWVVARWVDKPLGYSLPWFVVEVVLNIPFVLEARNREMVSRRLSRWGNPLVFYVALEARLCVSRWGEEKANARGICSHKGKEHKRLTHRRGRHER